MLELHSAILHFFIWSGIYITVHSFISFLSFKKISL